jgi:hypothetical protein
MKRQLIEIAVDSPGTSTITDINQTVIIAALTALGLPALSITVHRVLAYQVNPETEGYGPLVLTDGYTGYAQEFTGIPGVKAPSGSITYPAQYSTPFPGTSTSTVSIANASFVDRLYVDVSIVSKPASFTPLDVPDDISDFQTLNVVSPPSPVPSSSSRTLRARSFQKK